MNGKTADRVAKLIPLLSSDQGGEVAAAANRITAVLSEGGCDWHDVAKAVRWHGGVIETPINKTTHVKPEKPAWPRASEFADKPVEEMTKVELAEYVYTVVQTCDEYPHEIYDGDEMMEIERLKRIYKRARTYSADDIRSLKSLHDKVIWHMTATS